MSHFACVVGRRGVFILSVLCKARQLHVSLLATELHWKHRWILVKRLTWSCL